eukprot:gene24423-29697_t
MNTVAWDVTSPRIRFIAAPSDEVNNYSPSQVMNGTFTQGRPGGSCTSCAVFFVAACRAVGIPARVAGVPHWNKGFATCPHGDSDEQCGDHNWAEVWADGAWHFVDPAGDLRLDHGWFYP